MLKVIALVSCVFGFVFLIPKAAAEFYRVRQSTPGQGDDKPQKKVA
jgi:hypothetical protein